MESLEERITPSNSPPIVNVDIFGIRQFNGTFELDVLANDSDPDGDTLSITSVADFTFRGGTLSITDNNTLEFTPNSLFQSQRAVFFDYTVSDGCTEVRGQAIVGFLESDPEAGSDIVVIEPKGEENEAETGNQGEDNSPPVEEPPIGNQDEVVSDIREVPSPDRVSFDFANQAGPAEDTFALLNDQQAAIALDQNSEEIVIDNLLVSIPFEQREDKQEVRNSPVELKIDFESFLLGSSGEPQSETIRFQTVRLKTLNGTAQDDLATIPSNSADFSMSLDDSEPSSSTASDISSESENTETNPTETISPSGKLEVVRLPDDSLVIVPTHAPTSEARGEK